MFTIALNKARFIAPVGLYPQESIINNEIEVDLAISLVSDIHNLPFIDYVELYQLVKRKVLQGEPLLENILQQIVGELKAKYPDSKVRLSIRKIHPPLGGTVDSSMVSWED